jgi:hypothetical protein
MLARNGSLRLFVSLMSPKHPVLSRLNVVNFDQTGIDSSGTIDLDRANGGAMTSIVPFIRSAVFEVADIRLMSDAYNQAIEDLCSFGHPNAIVEGIMATRIINLTKGGERDPIRLRESALAACGFNLDRAGQRQD